MTLYVLKLVTGGTAAFCAVILWSRTRDLAWTCLLGGIVLTFAETIYSVLTQMNVIASDFLSLGTLSVTAVIFAVLPAALIVTGIILMILRYRK